MIIFIYIYLLLGIINLCFGFFLFFCFFRIIFGVFFFPTIVRKEHKFYDTKIQPRNRTGLATNNTLLLTNNTLLGSNRSRSVYSNGNLRKKNFSSSAPVSADNKRESVNSTTSSSYNGSNPELLYDRSDKLQERAVNISVSIKNLDSYRGLTSKYDNNPASLTTNERITLEAVKKQMHNYDKDISVTDNLNQEVNKRTEIMSRLDDRHMAKLDKANDIVSQESVDPVSPNKSTDNQTPTEYVHELESTSPMHIIPDDD